MSSVKVTDRIRASVAQVWDLVGDFGGIQRFSAGIKRCTVSGTGVGAVRTIELPNGVTVQERLELLDPARHILDYAIVGGPMPLSGYVARIQLSDDGDGTRIEWSSSFEPNGISEAQAVAMVEGIYKGGVAGLKKALGG